ncbi:hypothetical protein [Gluconobacter sp. OJB]|uniref:hypothetical protein n=1 Tax=Gluconobacter sp. OJB TaxID=3145196 RepID=UPI0031F80650
MGNILFIVFTFIFIYSNALASKTTFYRQISNSYIDKRIDINAEIINGIPISQAVQSCQTDGATTYYGAENSASQMGVASNTQNLRATGNVLPYLNVLSLAAGIQNMGSGQSAVDGPVGLAGMQAVVSAIRSDGIGEEWYTKYLTPNVAASELNGAFTDTSGNPVDDAAVFNSTGFKPSVMMLNVSEHSTTTSQISDADVTAFKAALADVPTKVTSVKYVWPFIAEAPSDTRDFTTDDYYANSRAIIQAGGGVGIDIPAGLYVLNGESSLAPNINTIKYANANGLRSIVLLSPYGVGEGDDYDGQVFPQWRHDSHFLDHVRMLVGWLKENDALPAAWAVVSYSPTQYWDPVGKTLSGSKDATHTVLVTANTMGNDTDSTDQSVAYVARWVAENAPTSLTVKMPTGVLNQGSAAICAATTLAGNFARKPSLGANMIGLGSLAWQDSNKTALSYPAIDGAQFSGSFNLLTGTVLAWGIGEATTTANYVYQKYDKATQTLQVQGNHSITGPETIMGNLFLKGQNAVLSRTNILMNGGGVAFGLPNQTKKVWITNDGAGGLILGKGLRSYAEGFVGLNNMTKENILSYAYPKEGMIVNDSDEHMPVIYENGHWHLIHLGRILQ